MLVLRLGLVLELGIGLRLGLTTGMELDRFEAIFVIWRNEPKEDVTLGVTLGWGRRGLGLGLELGLGLALGLG